MNSRLAAIRQHPSWPRALSRLDTATLGPLLALILMFVIYTLLSPNFLTVSNMTNVLVQASPLLILATGQTFALLVEHARLRVTEEESTEQLT